MSVFFRRYQSKLHLGEKEVKRTLIRRLYWILAIVILHAIAFYSFEPVSFREAIWVTITTLTTVGYGDISATTVFGQISTTVLCFLVGIPVLASVWDAYATWRDGVRDQKRAGTYNWDLKDHILIANFPDDYSIAQMVRLIKAIRSQPSLVKKPIQILTRRFKGEHLAQDLIDLGNIAHVNGLASSKKTLQLATADQASHVIILRDRDDNDPEGHSFNICSRIREVNPNARVIVQVDDPNSRAAKRLYRIGATSLLRPAKAYPEIIALSMLTEGVNDLFEDLLSIDGTEFRLIPYMDEVKWSEIQSIASNSDYGAAIGIQQEVVKGSGQRYFQPLLAPAPDFQGYAHGIYVISRKKNGSSFTDKEWQTLFNKGNLECSETPCSTLNILNLPVNQACPFAYFSGLLYQLRSTRKFASTQINVMAEEIPDSIKIAIQDALLRESRGETPDWIWSNVSFIEDVPSKGILELIDDNRFDHYFDENSIVAILNNDDDNDPDGYTYELIDLLRVEGNYQGIVVAESESDNERERLYNTGADLCLRPVRGYPGMLARTLTNPGVEKAIEAFFRFNDLHIVRKPVSEIDGVQRHGRLTFGDIKQLDSVRSKGLIPLSVRNEDAQEDAICPAAGTDVETAKATMLILERS